jgi:hypothetical protein
MNPLLCTREALCSWNGFPGARGAKQMKSIMHVLMIGVENPPDATNNPESRHEYRFIAAKACAELMAVATTESICVALLYPALQLNELARCAQAVRWRWPAARILVLRAEEPHIDDALYDERLEPDLSPELLLTSIARIIDTQRRASESVRLWEC